MPQREMEVRKARSIDRAYRLNDGGGLHLLVKPTGSKLWQKRYRFANGEKTLSHGAYPDVGIAEAR